jgi:predicted aspartyl protease
MKLLLRIGIAAGLWMCAALARADMPALSREFEQYMQAHHYAAVRLESGGTNKQWIEAKINGVTVHLILDTGCPRTSLTYSCARDLGLDIHDLPKPTGGLDGEVQGKAGIALIKSFQLPFGEINRTNTIMVLPKHANMDWGADGLLGLDYLILNAAVYPVGGRGILLKPGPASAAPISDYMTRLGFKPVPLFAGLGHIWVQGHINGVAMKFLVDTGAPLSDFRAESVRAAMGGDVYQTPLVASGLDGKREASFQFTPPHMDIGGIDLSHESFLSGGAFIFEHEHFDGLVGFDLMGAHRGIIDLGGHILWMK